MRTALPSLVPLLLLTACASGGRPEPLARQLARISRESGGTISVAFLQVDTGASFYQDADERMHPASTIKVPVMIALFEAADRGQVRLDESVAVRNEFKSLLDGSRFALDPKEDGDPDLYRSLGRSLPLAELIRHMIVRSSNLATNLLIEKIGASQITDVTRRLGARELRVLRGVEDQKAFDAGMNNVATARDLAALLRALLPGGDADDVLSPGSRRRMIEILAAQEFNEKIPAGLPPGVPVAHKTGDITGTHHDAAIVFPPGEPPYVLVVLTTGIRDEKVANKAISDVSRAFWERRGAPPGP
jgi:beta-lactamase class A